MNVFYNRSSNAATARIIVLNTDVVNYGLLVTEAREILDLDESILKQMGLVNYSKTRYVTAVANLENRMITM
ncbi:Chemotaxis protein CheW OS=Lysinibacillus sphaericus OX=1421 GN=LS41612_09280 PE=4 SV=1 [Lysinibacillus sphaericus]